MPEHSRLTAKLLVVDDATANVELLRRLLTREGYEVCTATNGAEALEVVKSEAPDLVISDVMMPELNGFQVCNAIKQNPATRLTPVVLITALSDRQDKIKGIEAGADDFLLKPFDAHELIARVRSLVRIKHYTDDLDTAEAVIISLALTIEARDPHTEGHCQRLARYAVALGSQLGMDEDALGALRRGGYLHDIGKIGVPDSILLKTGPLTEAEFEQMKQHTVIGDRLCGELRVLRHVRPIVRHHHERLDGSGYPDGLTGDQIPLTAQVMGIVDIFDAMTTKRPYKPALSPEVALQELVAQVKKGWRRADLVNAFIQLVQAGLPNEPVPVTTASS